MISVRPLLQMLQMKYMERSTKQLEKTLGLIYHKISPISNESNKKPWFNGECRTDKRKCHLAKHIYYRCNSTESKDNLRVLSKTYKNN